MNNIRIVIYYARDETIKGEQDDKALLKMETLSVTLARFARDFRYNQYESV